MADLCCSCGCCYCCFLRETTSMAAERDSFRKPVLHCVCHTTWISPKLEYMVILNGMNFNILNFKVPEMNYFS